MKTFVQMTRLISKHLPQIAALMLSATALFVAVPARAETCEDEKLRVEEAFPDTTVVCEYRPTGDGVAPGRPSGTGEPAGRPHGGGGGGRPSPRQHYVPFRLAYEDFEYTDENDNSQKTKCIPIRFKSTVGGEIAVNIEIFVPKELQSGRKISPDEAQKLTYGVTSNITGIIVVALNNGDLNPIRARNQFLSYLRQAMKDLQLGITVKSAC